MPENPQDRQTIEKLSSNVVEAAGELAANAIDLLPDVAIKSTLGFGGNDLEGQRGLAKAFWKVRVTSLAMHSNEVLRMRLPQAKRINHSRNCRD